MSDSKQRLAKPLVAKKRKFSRKMAIISVVLPLVIVALTVGGYMLYMYYFNKAAEQAQLALDQKRTAERQVITDTAATARGLVSDGKTSDAVAVYTDAVSKATGGDQKSSLLMSEATLLFNNAQYDESLDVTKQIETIGITEVLAQFMAQIYEKKGDNAKAAEYYQKAIGLVDPADPLGADSAKYYKDKVVALGGVK